MKITCTKPNEKNGLKGSRITIKDDQKNTIDQFIIHEFYPVQALTDNPNGKLGKRFAAAVEKAKKSDETQAKG